VKQEIAEEWARVLRSGQYTQRSSALRLDGRYCCLGVLCEMAVLAGVPVVTTQFKAFWAYDGETEVLPESVMRWSGMVSPDGLLGDRPSLMSRNDRGDTFRTIADIIERDWRML
jgi:hypothetical protein